MEGHGHRPLDFHASQQNLQLTSAGHRRFWRPGLEEEEASRWARDLMGIAGWHIQTLSHQVPSTFGRLCLYSHHIMLGERPTWNLTLSGWEQQFGPKEFTLGIWSTVWIIEVMVLWHQCPTKSWWSLLKKTLPPNFWNQYLSSGLTLSINLRYVHVCFGPQVVLDLNPNATTP